jgi:hypothetical protein
VGLDCSKGDGRSYCASQVREVSNDSHRVTLCGGMTPLCAAAAVPATQTVHRLCTQAGWLEPQNCGSSGSWSGLASARIEPSKSPPGRPASATLLGGGNPALPTIDTENRLDVYSEPIAPMSPEQLGGTSYSIAPAGAPSEARSCIFATGRTHPVVAGGPAGGPGDGEGAHGEARGERQAAYVAVESAGSDGQYSAPGK